VFRYYLHKQDDLERKFNRYTCRQARIDSNFGKFQETFELGYYRTMEYMFFFVYLHNSKSVMYSQDNASPFIFDPSTRTTLLEDTCVCMCMCMCACLQCSIPPMYTRLRTLSLSLHVRQYLLICLGLPHFQSC